MYRFFNLCWLVPVLLVLSSWILLAAQQRAENIRIIDKSLENVRDEPNGKKIGSLLKETEIEEIGREGNWVRFRVEGWVWGPSLVGFEEEVTEKDEKDELSPLFYYMPKVKRLINDEYGIFYGIRLDKDFKRLEVRLRLRDLAPEVLALRQKAIQLMVCKMLIDTGLEFDLIRIESNRPDGSGQVGIVMVETAVKVIGKYGDELLREWKEKSRFTSDGGETWSPL